MSRCVLDDKCTDYSRTLKLAADAEGYALCDKCSAAYTGDIQGLLYDYLDLSQVLTRRDAGVPDVQISRPRPESVPPIDMAVSTLRTDIAMALVACEIALRMRMRLAPRDVDHSREGHNVHQAAALVAVHVDTLAGMAWLPQWMEPLEGCTTGAQAVLMLSDLHRRARRMLGLAELTIALPGICPRCHLHALARRDGSDRVQCTACSHAMLWPQYQRLVTLVVTKVVPAEAVTD